MSIFKADIYRFIHGKIMWITGIIILAYTCFEIFPIRNLIIDVVMGTDDAKSFSVMGHAAYATASFSTLFMFIVPFLIVFFIASEYSKKTMSYVCVAQMYKGSTRISIFSEKYLSLTVVIFAFLLASAIVSTVLATICYGWGSEEVFSPMLKILLLVIKETLVLLVESGITIILALIINRSAIVVILFFASSLVESILSNLCSNLRESSKLFDILGYLFPTTYQYEFILGEGMDLKVLLIILACIAACIAVGTAVVSRQDINA